MSEKKLDRRQFFERALLIGASTFGAGAFLAACKSEAKSGGGAGSKAPAAVDCTDLSALSEQEKKTREALKYVNNTPEPAKNCANCKLFVSQPPCNKCTAVPGPIAAGGYCTAWISRV